MEDTQQDPRTRGAHANGSAACHKDLQRLPESFQQHCADRWKLQWKAIQDSVLRLVCPCLAPKHFTSIAVGSLGSTGVTTQLSDTLRLVPMSNEAIVPNTNMDEARFPTHCFQVWHSAKVEGLAALSSDATSRFPTAVATGQATTSLHGLRLAKVAKTAKQLFRCSFTHASLLPRSALCKLSPARLPPNEHLAKRPQCERLETAGTEEQAKTGAPSQHLHNGSSIGVSVA